ncbi:uncharacterized protein DEA37_0002290 [Paragonimus westermani]|uniref:Trematode PH-like domain-containing protein n=1 Tax=Paragonimus westermani TaxID=34504 RepID=A0A5J4NZC7_9TREM|nr:uncharacterized protein DEA37_0002290 [Paragonimus westermani]
MNGYVERAGYFEDRIRLTGFKICRNIDREIRDNAASLMQESVNIHTSASLKLVCFQEILFFSPPLYINNTYHRQDIPHRNILGFFLAPTFNTRLILVVQEKPHQNISLYGIQLSSPHKTQELSTILGEVSTSPNVDRPGERSPRRPADQTMKTVTVIPTTAYRFRTNNQHEGQSTTKAVQYKTIDASPAKVVRSELLWDNGFHSASPLLKKVTDTKLENGHNSPVSNGSRKPVSKSPVKIPGIVSSDIENDWDDIRPMSCAPTDDNDELISIGYYNDETDASENTRVHRLPPRQVNAAGATAQPNAWMENITYISNDPKRGSHVTAHGSIYMYVAQQVNPRTEKRSKL